MSVTHPPPSPLAEEAVQGLCREGNAGRLPAALRLPSLALSTQSLCLCPHFQFARGVAHGTPKRRRRMWWTRGGWNPEFRHEDERTWAARSLLCSCSLLRIPRSVPSGPCQPRYDAGDCLACVWIAPGGFSGWLRLVFSRARARELTIPSPIVCAGSFAASRVTAWSSRKRAMLSLQRGL